MKKEKYKLLKVILCASAIGIVNGLLGGGGGMLCVPALISLGKLSTKTAHATTVFIMLPISIISAIVYSTKISIDINIIILVTFGSIIGGRIGTKFLKNINSIVIEYIFTAVILFAGIRMIF